MSATRLRHFLNHLRPPPGAARLPPQAPAGLGCAPSSNAAGRAVWRGCSTPACTASGTAALRAHVVAQAQVAAARGAPGSLHAGKCAWRAWVRLRATGMANRAGRACGRIATWLPCTHGRIEAGCSRASLACVRQHKAPGRPSDAAAWWKQNWGRVYTGAHQRVRSSGAGRLHAAAGRRRVSALPGKRRTGARTAAQRSHRGARGARRLALAKQRPHASASMVECLTTGPEGAYDSVSLDRVVSSAAAGQPPRRRAPALVRTMTQRWPPARRAAVPARTGRRQRRMHHPRKGSAGERGAGIYRRSLAECAGGPRPRARPLRIYQRLGFDLGGLLQSQKS